MQRDFILRLIEQAGTALKLVLGRLREGGVQHSDIAPDLQRAALLGGLDLDLLRVFEGDGLLQLIAPTGDAEPAHMWLAAEVLFLDALAQEADGNAPLAHESFYKAASLYRMLEPTWALPTGFPEATDRIAEIESHLANIPPQAS
jgi:hypothetical protein